MKYIVQLGAERIEVSIDGTSVQVAGEQVDAELVEVPGTPVQGIRIDGVTHRVIARREAERGRYTLSIGGWRHEVEALDERSLAIRELSAASAGSAGPAPLKAPMPGLVVRVDVSPGDEVTAGQPLVVMEAMKMENELRAPSAGRVRAVHATVGSAVEKGALLVELE